VFTNAISTAGNVQGPKVIVLDISAEVNDVSIAGKGK
jgi:hypothetical protein